MPDHACAADVSFAGRYSAARRATPVFPASSARRMRAHTSSDSELSALGKRGKKRRATVGLIAAAEPQRARVAQCFGAAGAQAALQRVTQEFGIVAVQLRVFRVEQIPLLLAGEQPQPVGAQAVGDRPVSDAFQQSLHLRGRRVFETQPELPVGDVRFERVVIQRFGKTRELDGIAGCGTPRARQENHRPGLRPARPPSAPSSRNQQ